jgi:16S rRNA (uracil1498-N3)-methyltransferase
MQLPYFYQKDIDTTKSQIVLSEETSKHCVQVLRMKAGEQLQLTNGIGDLLTAEIIAANKKNCIVTIIKNQSYQLQTREITIAISLLKNASRFEWFLEKATEIGVAEIFPLSCDRTEKQHFRLERMRGILISAMLQSQQLWLPEIHEPIPLTQFIHQNLINEN